MKDIFKLYINNNLVDFELEPAFPVTYQQEDFSNPTIIKNSFSKTIKIEGTDNNNRIFGEIYNLDRTQLYKFNKNDNAYFDPSKRTPFELYKNSELLESGYMQLTDITMNNSKIIYNITLYGGLGDFFYSLMYNDDGESKTLADLWYKIKDKNGNLLERNSELDFNINKEFVATSWTRMKNNTVGNTINDLITFAPAYNGLYEDFDNSTICVNTYESQVFNLDNTITEDKVTYTTYEGYKLAKTEKDWTEWEVRDLRSYMQRPCLRFKKLFEAFCDEDNNGGYKVNLDKSFFNEKNPYYESSYMALPLLPTTITEENESYTSTPTLDTIYYDGVYHIGYMDGAFNLSSQCNLKMEGDINSPTNTNYLIDTSTFPTTTSFDLKLDFALTFTADKLDGTLDNDELFLSHVVWSNNYIPGYDFKKEYPRYKSIIVYAEVEDITSGMKYRSNILNFSNSVTHSIFTYKSTPDKWANRISALDNEHYVNVDGSFKRLGNTNNYRWTNNNINKFSLDIKNIPRGNKLAVAFAVKLMWDKYENNVTPLMYNMDKIEYKNLKSIDKYLVKGYATAPLSSSSEFIRRPNAQTARSNSSITKQKLLKTEFTPCDVLLDYCKLFGLYFTKDIHSKTINIITKNNFFTGNVIDVQDRIDHSQEMKIKPFLFETKYYLMKNEDNDSYFSKKYKNEYNIVYGQKRIDTNYNFNKDTKEVYEGSVFQNAISASDTSPFYRTFKNEDGLICPSWLMENPKMELYNGIGTDEVKKYETAYQYDKIININHTQNWNKKGGYDMFAKTCFYTLDNNSKSLSDISSTLLLFNGFKETLDNGKENETQALIPYWLTDDTTQMVLLNEDVCHLYTENEYDMKNKRIAYKYTELPQFLRYVTNGNTVTDSLDFGIPKEIYDVDVNYSEDATLYNKFWKNYLTDRYDVNTRKVTCYLNLEGLKINQESMRDFYYFNNCIWVMNKIENYFPNSYKTTRVELVKVNDVNNYLNAVHQYESTNAITLSANEVTVDYDKTEYKVDVTSENDWNADKLLFGNTVTPSSGTQGTTSVVISFPPNTLNYSPISIKCSFNNVTGQKASIDITQLPSPTKAKKMYGYVYSNKTQKPCINYKVSFTNDSENYTNESATTTNDHGFYEVWVGNNLNDGALGMWVSIYDSNGEQIMQNIIDWNSLKYDNKQDFELD